MKKIKVDKIFLCLILLVSTISYVIAMPLYQSDNHNHKIPKQQPAGGQPSDNPQAGTLQKGKLIKVAAQPLLDMDDDTIPDSLLHPRWKIQHTLPVTVEDLSQNALDLQRPANLKYEVQYDDSLNRYVIGNKIGNTWLNAPISMTPEEYMKWSGTQARIAYYRSKNDTIFKRKGKEKFDFSDMHFDLGPAEKIFGPGGVRIKTQGTAELKLGGTLKYIDNPSLTINNRRQNTLDFDEKINLSVNGKVGDKVNLNLNYNTDATFDFDAQNMKLKYDGKEDEIIKHVEAGNISFPSNSSLISGTSSLFGIRTDMQFGKLKLQMVASQKKSNSKSVSSSGGVQTTPFDIDVANYEENRHFFLSQYFRNIYDNAMSKLPAISTGVNITRVEIWVTNKTATTSNTRNIVALTDLGENTKVSKPGLWGSGSGFVPSNSANNEYATINALGDDVRNIDQVSSTLEGHGLTSGVDFEKLQSARLLSSSEYTLNKYLGYVSLNSTLQTDQVLGIAYEYTYGGRTYQVGEFSTDHTNTGDALLVKSLKNVNNYPGQGNWDLMMKNVYYLASTVEKDKFRLNIKYQSDTTGVSLNYIPESQVKSTPLIKVVGADRLDDNNNAHSNGYYDYVDGYTVSGGRVFIPKVEPFGSYMYDYLVSKGVPENTARKYSFTELYDSTKTVAKQIAEKDKYELVGQFRGTTANVISLGAYNVPEGSVVVTAGGVTLTEGVDYSVDYSAGEVTILNQSIIDAGTAVNVSLESNTDYGQMRKTMLGMNWEYDFTKNFQMSGTIQHLSEQSLTTKVTMGSEPVNNTIWGININWNKESQWLTNMLDKLPLLHLTEPSKISFKGEFAQLLAGQASGTQDNASYIDDFENSTNDIDVGTPTSWIISSVPYGMSGYSDKTGLSSGYNRSRLAWYHIDPLFTNRSSSLTPGYIKSDLNQLSNHYVRAVYENELYPNKQTSNYSGASSTIPMLNIAFYPSERGPYNFNTSLNSNGTLSDDPTSNWGGMMRKLDTNDFETANIEYIEFWMMDPFIYSNQQSNASHYGGDVYFDLGDISEDVLKDGKKFYESGMSVDGTGTYTITQWGKVPENATTTYAFATSSGSRAKQDVGFNGLTDAEEQTFFNTYLNTVHSEVSDSVYRYVIAPDPANDDYHYFRGSDYDQEHLSILDRYKKINSPQGNSPDSETRTESYDTSYKSTPDVEDINQDYTLNENDRYYQYHVNLRPNQMSVGSGFIVDKRVAAVKLRNGETDSVTWYQYRIPIEDYENRVGGINDYSSIRFMRIFLTGFQKPIIIRLASLDLVRGEWRNYAQQLSSASGGSMTSNSVSIEENNDKTPVNYVLPPGISRATDPTQSQLVEQNEAALSLIVKNLSTNEAHAVYKNTTLDLREYKTLQMFVHANALDPNISSLQNDQLAVFIRLGSDYKNNYYEYEIPLTLTPAGKYNRYSLADCKAVWPEANMLNVPLALFSKVKKNRNIAKAEGLASYIQEYSQYDANNPSNRVSIMGNPTLGEIKTIMIGVRNKSAAVRSGEIWVNELRVLGENNSGGWAAQANLNMQLSDLGTVNVQGKYVSSGFGGLEDGILARSTDNVGSYTVTTSLDLGKFFPDKAKVTIPLYYSVTKQTTTPKYNPLDTDVKLSDALDVLPAKEEKDSLKSIAITRITNTNLSVSNAKVGISTKHHPMPYDPANFSFSYSHSHSYTTGETTVYEKNDNWAGSMNYSWTPVFRAWEPFKNIKSRSRWLDLFRKFGLNWIPQNVVLNSEMTRTYYELQERDMEEDENSKLPLTFNEQFLWNRDFSLRWDFTKNLHVNFESATNAEIEEPNTPVNKNLYAEHYQAWKDSVWQSIKHMGTPLDYQQNFTLSYQPPINLIPTLDWVNLNGTYSSVYTWVRGPELEDSTTAGNSITTDRNYNINGSFNLLALYNHIPFLKKANEKFDRQTSQMDYDRRKQQKENERRKRAAEQHSQREEEEKVRKAAIAAGKDPDAAVKALLASRKAAEQKNSLPKNKRSFEKEITLRPDTTLLLNHGKNTRRVVVSAKTADGKSFKLKYSKVGKNKIRIKNNSDSLIKIKVLVTPKDPLENQTWYKVAQATARVLMMVRNVSISYRDEYAQSLPGFMPNIGNVFGQTHHSGVYSPGINYAFGLVGDSYIDKALDRGWLLADTTLATPATSNETRDLQLQVVLEPFRNFKVNLNASCTETKAKSIEYMYACKPTTQSGTFTMTTISIKSAFEGTGNANNGYHSKSFEKFCNSLSDFQKNVESQYAGFIYPAGSKLAGAKFDAANGTVNEYSGDVLIPAFLKAYANGGNSLNIFPTLGKLLPNWSFTYSGLGKLPWFRDHFKSINISHGYKSIYAVGSYSSYSSYQEYMNGLGFVTDPTTGNPVPNSMYNVSTVSINEAFSPLLGISTTFNNNMTAKLEYRTTRVLSLSMTSIQINEATSHDLVFGWGYRISNFNMLGGGPRVVKSHNESNHNNSNENSNGSNNRRFNGINHDLNLQLDLSLRKQASITRDIATITSTATSGNTAFKLSFAANYTLSRMLTLSFYYDRQTNTPLLSSSSYPTTTQDFGLSIKFSLTR